MVVELVCVGTEPVSYTHLCLSSDNGIEWSGRYRQYGKSKRGIV